MLDGCLTLRMDQRKRYTEMWRGSQSRVEMAPRDSCYQVVLVYAFRVSSSKAEIEVDVKVGKR